MKLSVIYDKDNEIIIAKPVGNITKENVKATAMKALELSKKCDCDYLLFDVRKCPVAQSDVEGFFLMKNMEETTGLTLKHRVAIVYDPALYPKERAQFIENVVVNRINPVYKMFMSIEDALLWLKNLKSVGAQRGKE